MVLSELTSDAGTRRVAKDRTGPPYGRRYERQHKGGGDVHDLEENGLSTEDPKGIFPVKVKIKNSVN